MLRKIVLKNDLEQLPQMMEFVEETGDCERWSPDFLMNVCLVLEEAVTNVMLYAYEGECGRDVELGIDAFPEEVSFILTDSGIPFDPTKREAPDLSLPPEKRPIGGLGIVLMHKIMDEVKYSRTEGRNVLVMKKRMQPA